MFSDLVGSTALSARLDPEDLREVISAYQKCVAETVRRFGGFVAKYMGDGALVYFGYPQAHEDDAERAAAFYNQRGTAEQWIKEGKGAIKWTRLSCRKFAANAARLQLHALAYNLGNFLRIMATPQPIRDWSLTSLKEKLIKIGAKVVRHSRHIAFQMAEVAIPRDLFADILRLIAKLGRRPIQRRHDGLIYPCIRAKFIGELRPHERKINFPGAEITAVTDFGARQSP
jgi:hypothetical protein